MQDDRSAYDSAEIQEIDVVLQGEDGKAGRCAMNRHGRGFSVAGSCWMLEPEVEAPDRPQSLSAGRGRD